MVGTIQQKLYIRGVPPGMGFRVTALNLLPPSPEVHTRFLADHVPYHVSRRESFQGRVDTPWRSNAGNGAPHHDRQLCLWGETFRTVRTANIHGDMCDRRL